MSNDPNGAPRIATQALSNDNRSSIALTLIQLQDSKEIIQLEMIKFDEDPSKSANFMRTFRLTVDAANLDVIKKLLHFIQYLKGE